MKITHRLPRLKISRDNCSASDFILTNGIGGFISLHKFPNSKHNGIFFAEGLDIFKVFEYIGPVDAPEIKEIENSLSSIKRKRGDLTETFMMGNRCNAFTYRLNRKFRIAIDMDCRKGMDFRDTGLYYQVTANGDHITVHFSKKTDNAHDDTHGNDEFELFIVFKPKSCNLKADYQFINEWNEFFYSLDASRHDDPKRYIYRPFIVNAKELQIGLGKTKEDALGEIKKLTVKPADETPRIMLVKKEKAVSAAFLCAQDSLSKLMITHKSIKRTFAGLPWFHQFWTRDESISLGAELKTGQLEAAKAVMMHYLKGIGKDGRIPNRVPSSDLASADGVGWIFKRLADIIKIAKERGQFDSLFSKQDIARIRKCLKQSIERVESSFMMSGLIHSDPLETWMDTAAHGDDRSGFRIEIQALHLNMLRLAFELTKDKKYHDRELEMRTEVKDNFWDGNVLADGLNDKKIRPNIFLAHYVYPDLLTRKEWETAFDSCIAVLWLDWGDGLGGLSSIDTSSNLMQWDYTGLNNMSYHRGDSWYWVNCMAAVCLLRNNAIKFESYIQKLIAASTEEILWRGAVGHHAEISSASHLSSHGCLAQAWSDAMFIELIMEAYR